MTAFVVFCRMIVFIESLLMVVFCATHLCLRSVFRAAVSVIAGLVVLPVTYLKV